MAKPGIKETEKTEYALKATGKLEIKDNKLLLDVSEYSDGSEVEDLIEKLKKVNGEMISFSVVKKMVEELE